MTNRIRTLALSCLVALHLGACGTSAPGPSDASNAVDAAGMLDASDANVEVDGGDGATGGDTDGDTIADSIDNCPDVANTDQLDADGDQKGDACDLCPAVSNPGTTPCPTTVYALRAGTLPVGTSVSIASVLVTAVRPGTGFFVQVKSGDTGYQGVDDSGLFVASTTTVAAGDRVDLAGTIATNAGVFHLEATSATVLSSGEMPPSPVDASVAEVATGGTRALHLLGVLVRVSNVTATAVDSAADAFTVDDALGVGSYLGTISPLPAVGQGFVSIVGVLAAQGGVNELEPRDSADLVLGAPVIRSFGPALSYVLAGASSAATGPVPLLVELSIPPSTDTFVAVSSSAPSSLSLPFGGVTIPAGQTLGTVLVDAQAVPGSVTLTATLGSQSSTATVRVYQATEVPALVALTPSSSVIHANTTGTFTVHLDLPAPPAGLLVSLSSTGGGGTQPAQIVVPAGQISATFEFVAGLNPASVDLTASTGTSMATASLTIVTLD